MASFIGMAGIGQTSILPTNHSVRKHVLPKTGDTSHNRPLSWTIMVDVLIGNAQSEKSLEMAIDYASRSGIELSCIPDCLGLAVYFSDFWISQGLKVEGKEGPSR